MFDPLTQTLGRLDDYPWWQVAVELFALWLLVWVIYRFIKGTRAAGALKGLVVLLVFATILFRVLARDQFPRLEVLFEKSLGVAAIALIVTFQPELRRLLIRLGETPFFRPADPEVPRLIGEIVDACEFLSRNKFGAIIAIERNVGLRELAEGGRPLNAEITSDLIETIFFPNTPLHDMGIVIRGRRIIAAGVQFPLAQPTDMPSPQLGTRHRAAVGLARVTDALVIVVSEETGGISIADGRRFERGLTPDNLRAALLHRLETAPRKPGSPADAAPEPAEDSDLAGASEPSSAEVARG